MPNIIDNKLQIIGSDNEVKEVLDFINGYSKSDEMHIDFNRITPMPDEIKNTNKNTISDDVFSLIFDYGGMIPESELKSSHDSINERPINTIKEQRENIKVMYENTIKYGYSDWYEWTIANWGTKWNAYHQKKDEDNTIHFSTAWTDVLGLMVKLSEKFTELTLKYTFCDVSNFLWYEIYEMKGGDIQYYKYHNCSNYFNKNGSQIKEGRDAE